MTRAILALVMLLALPCAADTTLRIATLAPEGSSWMREFQRWARKLEQKSGKRIRIKFYPGAVMGDEREMVHKLRSGALDGAALTPIGLSMISQDVLLFEVPFFIQRPEQLDYVRGKLDGELRKLFEERGFTLLAWGDVGPVHLFTNVVVSSRAELPKVKMWAWVDDPVVRAMFSELGQIGVPLGLPDVLPSLEKGLINGCYGSPLSVLAMSWHTRLKYMIARPLTYAIGAAVVSKRAFDRLEPEERRLVLAEVRTLEKSLNAQIRADNQRALQGLQRSGLKIIEPPAELMRDFETAALAVMKKLDGNVWRRELRVRVEELLAEVEKKRR